MALVDWVIVAILAVAVLGGMASGFFRSICGLGGLVLGLAIASWNYGRLAAIMLPVVRSKPLADTISFILIALLVMAIISLIGNFLARAFRAVGLGWLDGLAGAAFGFLQGMVLVVIGILAIVAFFPQEHWLAEARLPQKFFGICHVSSQMTPHELGERIRSELLVLGEESSQWMNKVR